MKYGTLSIEGLVQALAGAGATAAALTDINCAAGWFNYVRACRQAGIRPLLGIEFRQWDANNQSHTRELLFVALAQSSDGLQEMNELLTHHSGQHLPLPAQAPAHWQHCAVLYPTSNLPPRPLLPHEWVGIAPPDVPLLRVGSRAWPALAGPGLPPYAGHTSTGLRLRGVVLRPWVFAPGAQQFALHRLLRAVDHNLLLAKLPPSLHAPAWAHTCPLEEVLQKYAALPQVLENTFRLLEACQAELETDTPKNRRTYTATPPDDRALLHKLAFEGLEYRYGKPGTERHKTATTRLEKELGVIDQLDFRAYFLITWDFLRYARSRGFHHVGRGSGANSVAAYCMGITDVCPIELDLYFERFINPHRTSPPDFDIDFSWDERDDVLDYIFKRYGRRHVALLATYSTFQGRSIVREFGKALGLPKHEIDELLGDRTSYGRPEPWNPAATPEAAEQGILRVKNGYGRQELDANALADTRQQRIAVAILQYGEMVQNFPSHHGIHAGGVLITEEPITRHTPLKQMPKGFPITHWDMHVAEENGFYKYDVLSQRGLGHIKMAADIVLQNRGVAVDVHDVNRFKTDPSVGDMLRRGDTVGCFYVESPAMRQLIQKLGCADYLTLVAASSIIRPGVSSSGMMKTYIERHRQTQAGRGHEIEYLHPVLGKLMADTYGVMVYQEDVIKVAHHFCGLTLADADMLRRAMAGKHRSEDAFDQIRQAYLDSCAQRDISPEVANELWRQIRSFAGYSFSKAHSASFAVESYQSMWLKAHYPLEFYTAVINNFGGFYSTEFYAYSARQLGATLHPPCLNRSERLATLRGTDLYLGFTHIKGLEAATIARLLDTRAEGGPFAGLDDFLVRTGTSLQQTTLLLRVRAFRFTGIDKKRLRWLAHLAPTPAKGADASLFGTGTHALGLAHKLQALEADLPNLEHDPAEDAYDELELLGFYTGDPFELLHHRETALANALPASQLLQNLGKMVEMVGYFVTRKRIGTIPKNGEPCQQMAFGHWLDAASHHFDTVHFPESFQKHPFRGRGFYRMRGLVTEDFGNPNVDVRFLERLPFVPDARQC